METPGSKLLCLQDALVVGKTAQLWCSCGDDPWCQGTGRVWGAGMVLALTGAGVGEGAPHTNVGKKGPEGI